MKQRGKILMMETAEGGRSNSKWHKATWVKNAQGVFREMSKQCNWHKDYI